MSVMGCSVPRVERAMGQKDNMRDYTTTFTIHTYQLTGIDEAAGLDT